MSLPHGVIIAGGKGERLGSVRKAQIRIGGIRLIDRVAAALNGLETLLVAVGPVDDGRNTLQRAATVTDLDSPVGGPLAGLAAAVDWLTRNGITQGQLLSSAVDTPFLPSDFSIVLRHHIGDAPAAYAAWDDQFYPPNALWQLSALQDLPGRVRDDRAPPSLKALLRDLGAVEVDWQTRAAENPFVNLNTLDDLVTLGRRMKKATLSPLIHKRDD
ncbi:MAG: molybdenum cofactor guanylyltransferase [Candidatus Devosia phytovorans]|uniref:Molybdenum cofactor guanylyltransferase n=1 Tax=Candidatus Devosia phytovorans TaxID=3121372 RepID=A0AAJ5VY84_9HYPH|nr:molybdenum cofactor guanylyltransferase [Devosia sp.]WEK06370.1 MAG: molybdenum cofactor guanylyltransferase [Devosia sp.]